MTEREGKSIGLAFFLVVAIKSNLSTFAGAKIVLFSVLFDKNSEIYIRMQLLEIVIGELFFLKMLNYSQKQCKFANENTKNIMI